MMGWAGMQRHFDEELRALKERLLEMGSLAERNVHRAIDMLVMRDTADLDAIYRAEREINELHIEVDDRVIDLVARRQPVGSDLRFVMMAARIGGEVERIGDQAINITQGAERLVRQEPLGRNAILPIMAQKAMAMVRRSLEAFVKGDTDLARQVIREDQDVNAFRDQIFREMLTYMMEDSRTISRGLSQILVSRNLERIGDQATNIAEDVIYLVEAREVRHGRATAKIETAAELAGPPSEPHREAQ